MIRVLALLWSLPGGPGRALAQEPPVRGGTVAQAISADPRGSPARSSWRSPSASSSPPCGAGRLGSAHRAATDPPQCPRAHRGGRVAADPAAILAEASLRFLGLSDPNSLSWGGMLNQAQNFLQQSWWMAYDPTRARFPARMRRGRPEGVPAREPTPTGDT